MAHAVEGGVDHRVRADGGLHVFDSAGDRGSLYAEQDDVVRVMDLVRGDGVGLDGQVAGWADDLEAVALELEGA